jgi:RNA polymerase sigma factor (sigma-70 family)
MTSVANGGSGRSGGDVVWEFGGSGEPTAGSVGPAGEGAVGSRLSKTSDPKEPGEREILARLVQDAAAGNQDAWNTLVEKFAPTVWAIARGHRLSSADSTEVFQTTWLRLLEHFDRMEDPGKVGVWLATTARRECLRALRMNGESLATEEAGDVPTVSAPERQSMSDERQRKVNRLVEQLPVRHQILLRLLSSESPLTYVDISEALSMPIGSIGPTRARALARLRHLALAAGIDPAEVFLA